MKTLRLVSSPTRNRRLNEILGLTVLVGAGLLLLALASYTPSDPSFDTVGGLGASVAGMARPAHNWTGLVGAYFADALLQILGVSALFLPLLLVRLGVCWMRSKPAGSPVAKLIGLVLWVVFAPAAVALLPGNLLWRSSLPIAGLSGRLVADAMVHLLNLPGASIVVALMVALSLYLATTFTFNTAREWTSERFGFLGAARERWAAWRGRGVAVGEQNENGEAYGSRRAKLDEAARRERERLERQAAKAPGADSGNTLLGGLFGWLSRRKRAPEVLEFEEPAAAAPAGSMWEGMPRTNVDAPAVTALGVAAAAAAPYAQALAAAAAPLPLQPDEVDWREPERPQLRFGEEDEEPFSFVSKPSPLPPMKASAAGFASAAAGRSTGDPARPSPAPGLQAAPFAEAPAPTESGISFGKRADSEIKAVAITAKSVRGYKLPSSSLLYRSEEQAVVREEALREEARVRWSRSAASLGWMGRWCRSTRVPSSPRSSFARTRA